MTDIAVVADQIHTRLGSGGRLTVLTGAGISAESGVPTFRDMGGLWEKFDITEVASPEAFMSNPELVHRFYNERRAKLGSVTPNLGHKALVDLEQKLGGGFTLITQNVDDLHERAGSSRPWHMHGELRKVRCLRYCAPVEWMRDLGVDDVCERCGAAMRPHIVWFGELPFYMSDVIPEALQADVFMSIGTSGVVYPAAGFVATATANGALTVEINLEPTQNAFDIQLLGKAGDVLPALVARLSALA